MLAAFANEGFPLGEAINTAPGDLLFSGEKKWDLRWHAHTVAPCAQIVARDQFGLDGSSLRLCTRRDAGLSGQTYKIYQLLSRAATCFFRVSSYGISGDPGDSFRGEGSALCVAFQVQLDRSSIALEKRQLRAERRHSADSHGIPIARS